MPFCTKCGTELQEEAKFCSGCSKPRSKDSSSNNDDSWSIKTIYLYVLITALAGATILVIGLFTIVHFFPPENISVSDDCPTFQKAINEFDNKINMSDDKTDILQKANIGNIYAPEKTHVVINFYKNKPNSLYYDDTIVLSGLSDGEYAEINVYGIIVDFEHVDIYHDPNINDIESKVLNKLDSVGNQTIVIETYIPCGTPTEKVQWQCINGEKYQAIFYYSGKHGLDYTKEFSL